MNKKARLATLTSLLFIFAVCAIFALAAPKKCNNGLDDDNDGLADLADPGCSGRTDNTETNSALVCDNGLDATNDRDTLADYRLSGGDPGCTSPIDPSEIDGQCDDLADNDGDTYTDYPADMGCTSYSDLSELGITECDDGTDNDNDTYIDLNDAGCTNPSDNDETNCGDWVCEGGENSSNCPYDCGAQAVPEITIIPQSLDFGDVEVGSYKEDTITIRNDGNADLEVTNLTTTNPRFTVISPPTPFTVPYQDNIDEENVTIRFSPIIAGIQTGNLEIESNDPDEPTALAGLTGKGITQCSDGIDNDGDEHTDYLGDSKCTAYNDNDESPKDSCSDTDGGFAIGLQGTVSGDDESTPYSYTDFCLNTTIVNEYGCGGPSLDYAPLSYPMACTGNTTSCINGACV